MSQALKEPAEASTDLVVIERETALSVLTDPKKFDEFYERVRASTASLVPDVSTTKGRDHIRSMAMDVVRSKTAIDKAGLALTEDWRGKTAQVNAARKSITAKLDDLRDEVRKPLTEWEKAEEDRVAQVAARLRMIEQAASVRTDDSPDAVAERISNIEQMAFDADVFQDSQARAEAARDQAIATLQSLHARLVQEAADRAELAELRRKAAEREEKDRLAQEAADAKAKDDAAAEERERQRVSYAKRMIQHVIDCGNGTIGGQRQPYGILIRELEEKVVIDEGFGDLEAEAKQILASTLERLKADMKADAERAAADSAAAATRAAEEALRVRKEQDAQAAAAREKDRAHASKIMGAAKTAIMAHGGIDAEAATKIVKAIVAKAIPNISISF